MNQPKQRQPINKKEPGKHGHFIALPSDSKHYVHHELMSAEKVFLYQLIIDYFNEEEGWAFPSLERLSLEYGKAYETTRKHIEDLKAVGLIDYPEKGKYVPLQPLPAYEFYEKFPEAGINYRKKYNAMEKKKKGSKIRMQEWRKRKGYGS
ncbi:hypothetical protein V1502_17025 [Bacillus sp. SCS-153A]|uniref:hypothetical protein n=1 Tax=Rossellomorea sedimentorum TaxID=3115294 RepID=UPI0039063287